jgi:zinc protease
MDVPQAQVLFGAVTPALTWEQRRAERVLNSILNGEGRLFEEVRAKRGLVYSVGTSFSHYKTFSHFGGSFAAGIDDVPEALRVTMAELRRMAAEGPTEEEVATVRRAFVGSYLLGLDTGEALVGQMSDFQIFGRPTTFLDDTAGEIEKITRDDVWDAAKLLLNPDRFTVTIIAPPTEPKLCDAVAPQRP